CAFSATVYARRTSSGLSLGLIAVIVSSSGASSGSTVGPLREVKKDSRERFLRGAVEGLFGVAGLFAAGAGAGAGARCSPPDGTDAPEGGEEASCDMHASWLVGPGHAAVTNGPHPSPRVEDTTAE